MVDFKKKLKSRTTQKITDPKSIYDELDRQASAGPLRPIQERILNDWFNNRYNDKDVIIKLHTGEGKTLIGLLALQSRLNAGFGPCLYVCPSIQLAEQASKDATKFGIKHKLHLPGNEIPIEFLEGTEILITYVQKFFNGRSQFGIDNTKHINIGTVVLDDSHACIDSMRSSYSVRAKKRSDIYQFLINLFESSMRKQGEGSYFDIKNKETAAVIMQVPYWDWIDKKQDVAEFMSKHQDDDELRFVYPLLKDLWEDCSVYFTGLGVEIVPDYSLISRFTAFTTARQRIAMSATTQDDSFFVKGLGFNVSAIQTPLTNSLSKWSGEKMIIFPTRIDERLNTELMRNWACKPVPSGSVSKVILVPSNFCADYYFKKGAHIAQREALKEEISYLGQGSCYDHTVVFVNRYDGIDLPDNQCRILTLDSLPVFANLSDRYEQACREGSELIDTKIAQKIEQGLGRSVRSEKDYSVILIIGEDLIRFIKTSDNQRFFSSQTKKQIEIGEEITKSVKEEIGEENPFKAFIRVVKQCLSRDEDWKQYYLECMNEIDLVEDQHPFIDLIMKEYEAETAYRKHDYLRAEQIYQDISNTFRGRGLEQGWYLQHVAKCAYHRSKVDAERIQKKAHELNHYLLIPENDHYKPIGIINQSSLNIVKSYIAKSKTYDDLQLKVDAILSDLSFGVSSNKFEAALEEIGHLLGFISQRPDQAFKVGPDNLWMSPGNRHFINFECKNEVLMTRLFISKEEVGQMNNHIGWFEDTYGKDMTVRYVHIHPTNIVSSKANYNKEVLVISPKELDILKGNIKNFVKEFAGYDLKTIEEDYIYKAQAKHHLILEDIERIYAIKTIKEN